MAGVSVAASALSAAALGLKIVVALDKYIKDFRSADRDIKRIATEVRTTSWVLQELGSLLNRDDALKRSSPHLISEASETLDQCWEAFQDVKHTLQLSSRGGTLSLSARATWSVRKEKITAILDNLERQKSTVTLIIQLIGYTKDVDKEHPDADPAVRILEAQLASQVKAQVTAEIRYETLLETLQEIERSRARSPPRESRPYGPLRHVSGDRPPPSRPADPPRPARTYTFTGGTRPSHVPPTGYTIAQLNDPPTSKFPIRYYSHPQRDRPRIGLRRLDPPQSFLTPHTFSTAPPPYTPKASVSEEPSVACRTATVGLALSAIHPPVYPRVAKDLLTTDGLVLYQVPYALDRDNHQYVVILREMDHEMLHTLVNLTTEAVSTPGSLGKSACPRYPLGTVLIDWIFLEDDVRVFNRPYSNGRRVVGA